MGKVIRGSPASDERYTVTAPAASLVAAISDDVPSIGWGDAFAEMPPPGEVAAEPYIDFEALHAQAQELIDDAERRAHALVADAEERARALTATAVREAQTLTDDGRRSGHDEGLAAGLDAARAQTGEMLDVLRGLLESARAQRQALLASAEPELVRLAVGIAERVLHQQIALDNGVVVEMARAAIARLVDRETITVRVNPGDLERMREHRDALLALGDVKTMRVIEDQRVDRGGVILETDGGSIDAKISTQLAEARKILHIVDDVVVVPGAVADDGAARPARAS